ncbi:hypothetical protein I317_06674 [Kwoniella heveanensis CBS 569]|nr:hypothetical protein I317_06674 [Kwoniella heveanensis CBS 569]
MSAASTLLTSTRTRASLSLSPSFTRRLTIASSKRRTPPSISSARSLHTTASIRSATTVSSSSSSKPEPSLIPTSTALSALLSRLSLPANASLHPTLVACLTHPSFFAEQAKGDGQDLQNGEIEELEIVGQGESETTSASTSSVNNKESNELLATLGNSLLGMFASEHLSTLYPLLPTNALQSAITAYVGPESLSSVARELGVSVQGGGNTGLPGHGRGSNSAGLPIRWSRTVLMERNWKERMEPGVGSSSFPEKTPVGRRFQKFVKKSSRGDEAEAVVGDNGKKGKRESFEDVIASTVRAFVGLIYQEQGIHAARAFVHAHFLSRALDLSTLFNFKNPLHVLTSVVSSHLAQAGVPVASNQANIERRLLASTGVASQSPLFLVGLFLPSGIKLSEGHGSSKAMAEHRAAVNALLSLFLVRGDQNDAKALGGGIASGSSNGMAAGLGKKIGQFGSGLPSSIHPDRLLEAGKLVGASSLTTTTSAGLDEQTYQGVAWGGKDVLAESGRRRRV